MGVGLKGWGKHGDQNEAGAERGQGRVEKINADKAECGAALR